MISQELLNIPHVLPSIRFLQLKGTTSSLIHLVWLQHIAITHFQNRFERLGNLMQTLQSPIKGKLEIGNIDFPSMKGKRQQKRFKSVCHTICISVHWKHHKHKLEQNGDAHLKVNCLLALYWQYIDSILTVFCSILTGLRILVEMDPISGGVVGLLHFAISETFHLARCCREYLRNGR